MPKPEIKKVELADDSIVCWPKEYAHLEARDPSNITRQRVVAALGEFQPATAVSEYNGVPELTGRYAGTTSACCINQAGLYMVIWWSYVGGAATWHYGATYGDAGLFVVHKRDKPHEVLADLIVDLSGREPTLRFEWYPGEKGPDEVLVRFSERATLSDHALAVLAERLPKKRHPLVDGALRDEHAPLGPNHMRGYLAFFTGAKFKASLEDLFEHEVEHTAATWAEINVALRDFARVFYRAFDEGLKKSEIDGAEKIPPPDARFQAKAKFRLQELLHGTSLRLRVGTEGKLEELSLYGWLQRVAYYNENGAAVPNDRVTNILDAWLGVYAHTEYQYDLTCDLSGVVVEATIPFGKRVAKVIDRYKKKLPGDSAKRIAKWVEKKLETQVGARVLMGTLTIASRGRQSNWSADYWVMFFVTGGGAGGGGVERKYLKAKGSTTTNLAWVPGDFAGRFTVLTGQAARDTQGHLKDNQMIWIAEGSNSAEPSLQFLFNKDFDTDLSTQAVGLGWGDIVEPTHVEKEPPTPVVPKVFSYSESYAAAAQTHFALGSATVREEARQLLRELVANELVALRDPSCTVAFHGFADRLGGEGFNDVLSESRAENAKIALQDCAGRSVNAKLNTAGYGEQPLKFLNRVFDFPDGSPSPEWRRVFVVIEGVACVVLVVRDLKDTP